MKNETNQPNELKITEPAPADPWTKPLVLEGLRLRLETLAPHHLSDLSENLLTPHAWHSVHWQVHRPEDLERSFRRSHQARLEGRDHALAMIEKTSGRAVGMSRLMNFNRAHKGVEIGGTWIGASWQKSFVNTEAKLLMMTQAFEVLDCQRVEFRVDSLNFNSQRAVQRIGAKFEGELRQSALLPDGRKRDYKVYSILDSEWPNIQKTLEWYRDKYV
jgi:RimJ/RimL family protein N-acetyltransferase